MGSQLIAMQFLMATTREEQARVFEWNNVRVTVTYPLTLDTERTNRHPGSRVQRETKKANATQERAPGPKCQDGACD